MMLFQNPIVWLMRFRQRKGYGVHSPFAFDFITNVIYNKEKYYAYKDIDRCLRWWEKGRVKSMRHLAFRLTNFHEPKTIYCDGQDTHILEACKQGSKEMKLIETDSSQMADMILLARADEKAMTHLDEGTMLVLKNLRKEKDFWKRIKEDNRVTVTFDMYDVGVAFAKKRLNKQHYKINW